LRAIAAVSVLLTHWRAALFMNYPEIPHGNILLNVAYLVSGMGRQWVIVFFVMSGYLVGGSVLRSVHSGRWSWREYLVTRLTRLYVVLLPALLLGGAADWAGMHLPGASVFYNGHTGMGSQHFDIHSTLTLPVLLANAVFLQTISLRGGAIPTFGTNEPLWSLSNEFWYYIAFPLLVLGTAKAQRWKSRVGLGASLLALGWFVGPDIALLGVAWLMGALIPYLPTIPAKRRWQRRIAIAAVMALFAGAIVFAALHKSVGIQLLLGVAVALLIWVILNCATGPLPSGYVWLAQRGARSSYTLYLMHVPMLILIKASLHLPQASPSLRALPVAMVVLIAVIVYAQIVYELFEKNTGRVRNWIKSLVIGTGTQFNRHLKSLSFHD
jgi:peptidoglycan/LPS O-acetylase OafA/YrhL